jgi:parallel beta-helix repeat protein
MKNATFVASMLLIGVLLFGCASMNNVNYTDYTNYTDNYTNYTQNYTSNYTPNYTNNASPENTSPVGTYKGGPIFIKGDKEFTAANGVVSGSGTPNDPYVIEGWTIDASNTSAKTGSTNGVYIYDTSKYFVIRNCRVENASGYGSGISLFSVSNGKIENCTITNVNTGISLGSDHNIIVSGNTIEKCKDGISNEIYQSDGITISNNIITNGKGTGIYFHNLKHSFAINNIIRNNSGNDGIYISASINSTISNNIVQGNKWDGIEISNSNWKGGKDWVGGDNNVISNNDVSNNGGTGIDVPCVPDTYDSVTNNTVNGNKWGIYLSGTHDKTADHNIISHNTASNNKENGFYVDTGCFGNTVSYNTFLSNNANNEFYIDTWGTKERLPRWYDMYLNNQGNTLTENTYGTIYIYPSS